MKNTGVIVGAILVILFAILLLGGVGTMGLGGFGMMRPGITFAPHASAGVWCCGGYGNMMGGFGYGGMLFGGLLMLLFWVAVVGGAIWLVVALVRGTQSSNRSPISTTPPLGGQTVLDVLKLRYAKGEITKEQFEEMKRDLNA